MKKLILAAAIAALAGNVMAADPVVTHGKVSFVGKVVDQTCSIKSGSEDQTIILRTVQKSAFTATNKTAMETPFSISLEKCSAKANGIENVRLYFSSSNIDTATGTLTNQAGAPKAENVNIQLLDNNTATPTAITLGKVVDVATPVAGKIIQDGSQPIALTSAVSNPVFKYIARYYATDTAAVSVGDVKTNVDFTIAYE